MNSQGRPNFLPKGEKGQKAPQPMPSQPCKFIQISYEKCGKEYPKIYPRRIFEDRRDEGGGVVLAPLPLCSTAVQEFVLLLFMLLKSEKIRKYHRLLSINNLLFYFYIDVSGIVLDYLIDCSFNFTIILLFRQ